MNYNETRTNLFTTKNSSKKGNTSYPFSRENNDYDKKNKWSKIDEILTAFRGQIVEMSDEETYTYNVA